MNKRFRFLPLVGALGALAAGGAHAAAGAAVDVTDVTGTIAAQLVPIGLVGTAILGVVVAVAAFKWVKRGIN